MPLNLPPMKKKKATPPVGATQLPPPHLRKPPSGPRPIPGPGPGPLPSPIEAKKRGQKKALGIGV